MYCCGGGGGVWVRVRVRGGYWFRGSRTGFYRPETVCQEKIVLKINSTVMQTTITLFRKVHNYTHFKG